MQGHGGELEYVAHPTVSRRDSWTAEIGIVCSAAACDGDDAMEVWLEAWEEEEEEEEACPSNGVLGREGSSKAAWACPLRSARGGGARELV
jgi:hypothetical protein